MIPGISSGGGSQSLDLSAGPSQSGSIDQTFNYGGGPVIYAKNANDWKKYAVVGGLVLAGFWLSRKK
tara:strand:+ start:5988 stop:6188 length:201 start_codon:yes stop_codon:yes gene_type:complete